MDLYNLFLMLFYCGKNAECELSSLTRLRVQYGTVIYRCNVVGRTLVLILLASLNIMPSMLPPWKQIMQCLSCDWLMSFNMMSSRHIHVVENYRIPLLFMKSTSREMISHCASHHLLWVRQGLPSFATSGELQRGEQRPNFQALIFANQNADLWSPFTVSGCQFLQ